MEEKYKKKQKERTKQEEGREGNAMMNGIIIGVFIVILSSIGLQLYWDYQLEQKMAKDLYHEIYLNIIDHEYPGKSREMLEEFKACLGGQVKKCFSVEYFRGAQNDFYSIYRKDISLLHDDLRKDIVNFYFLLEVSNSISRKLEEKVPNYFRNEGVTGETVLNLYQKRFENEQSIFLLGAKIRAELISKYKADIPKNEEEVRNTQKQITEYLKNKNINDEFSIGEIISEVFGGNCPDSYLEIFSCVNHDGLITIIYFLIETNEVEEVELGKYKKINN